MKRYDLGATDESQYSRLTEAERLAWIYPEPYAYHSFHVERMGEDTYRWRNSREAKFYIGSHAELCQAITTINLRKLDPNYNQIVTTVKVLSQDEIDELFSDL